MSTTTPPTILLLGATGQVGGALHGRLSDWGTVSAPGRAAVDLTAPETIRSAVRRVEPDVIVNAAAYTAVDDAESAPEQARAVNARAPRVLAEAARSASAWLVHYSTDYVFDGTQRTPYVETDRPNPLNVYGRTKHAGERAVLDVGGRVLVLRTSWVYSDRRANFLRRMLRMADDRDELMVVDDQIGTPTWAGWIAEATTTILKHIERTDGPTGLSGLYHLAASGQTSRYGFAKAIFAQFGRDDVTVVPIPTEEYPTEAPRPAYTVLDSSAARQTFDVDVPTWTDQLDALRAQVADAEETS